MKKCVVLNGQIINVGDWNYQYQQVETLPAEYDKDGNVIKEAVFEQVATNPLPIGVAIEERDFEYSEDRGWYEVGTVAVNNDEILKAKIEVVTINTLIDLGVI